MDSTTYSTTVFVMGMAVSPTRMRNQFVLCRGNLMFRVVSCVPSREMRYVLCPLAMDFERTTHNVSLCDWRPTGVSFLVLHDSKYYLSFPESPMIK